MDRLQEKLVEKIAGMPYHQIPIHDRNTIMISILGTVIGGIMVVSAVGLALIEVKAEHHPK